MASEIQLKDQILKIEIGVLYLEYRDYFILMETASLHIQVVKILPTGKQGTTDT